MYNVRRSSEEWFKLWDGIIALEDTLSRRELSIKSKASIYIIKSLQLDWMSGNEIVYKDGIFYKHIPKNISHSLSRTEKEDMR